MLPLEYDLLLSLQTGVPEHVFGIEVLFNLFK